MKREKFLITAITLMGLISTIVFALEPGFEYKIPKMGNPPTIDGVLNDSIWSKVSSVKINHLNDATGTLVEAARVSTAMAAYDDKYLYIAIDNGEPNPGQITTVSPGHDQDVWKDDENELLCAASAVSRSAN